jgi:hypothetical protein
MTDQEATTTTTTTTIITTTETTTTEESTREPLACPTKLISGCSEMRDSRSI